MYRSVSNAEATDIQNTGRFNLQPGMMESKQFAFNLQETRSFGDRVRQEIIARAKIPTEIPQIFQPLMLTHRYLDMEP